MRSTSIARKRVRALVLVLLFGISVPSAVPAQVAELLEPRETQSALTAPQPAAPSAPIVVIGVAADDLLAAANDAAGVDPNRIARVRRAALGAGQAEAALRSGDELRPVLGHLLAAATDLDGAGPFSDDFGGVVADAGRRLVPAAGVLVTGVIAVAESAGVDRVKINSAKTAIAVGDRYATGNSFGPAASAYNDGFELIADTIVFDIDLFEDNIVDRVGPAAVGYAYAINKSGQLYTEGAAGLARNAADAPQANQSPVKEHFLASVSKTLTGVALQRALQNANISVSTPVSAYLPPYWPKGGNVGSLTFEQLLTHRSGFVTSDSNSYAPLRTKIAGGLPALPDSYDYSNANFGLMRILIPRVAQTGVQIFDNLIAVLPFVEPMVEPLYALEFMNYVRSTVFAPAGIDGFCYNVEANETRYYNMPHGGNAGYDEPSRLLSCGGFGWFLSARELAAFMAHLRYTTNILSVSRRQQMDQKALGWLEPTQFGWTNGAFGTYLNHGGDWIHGTGDAHTCIMKFPIHVEVSLVINSKHSLGTHQCRVLQQAFDAAWVQS